LTKEKVEKLISESLTIAVVKKNIFDIVLKTLETENIEAKEQLIIELVNKTPMSKFRELEKKKDDRGRYSKKVEEIVKVVIQQYMKGNNMHMM
jgi:dissimilatory sulfite reductase (desulfoviridin) alpha/beta subunit